MFRYIGSKWYTFVCKILNYLNFQYPFKMEESKFYKNMKSMKSSCWRNKEK